jgi:hypothetical protein
MKIKFKFTATGLAMVMFAASTSVTMAGDVDAGYCMDVVIEPFHMQPDAPADGSCTVRDYFGGSLQDSFYPFTEEEHLFNCEYFGPVSPLPTGDMVPSAVVSQGNIVGTIGGHPFEAKLACASLTNWYQDSCSDPSDPTSCTFQLAQPFLGQGLPYPRVTEVSIFDGMINVEKNTNNAKVIPVVMATRAAGITHLENLSTNPPLVGASITHSLLGLVVPGSDKNSRNAKVLTGSADLLLQGHIFAPVEVADDAGAAVIRGSICSKDLYKLLN